MIQCSPETRASYIFFFLERALEGTVEAKKEPLKF